MKSFGLYASDHCCALLTLQGQPVYPLGEIVGDHENRHIDTALGVFDWYSMEVVLDIQVRTV